MALPVRSLRMRPRCTSGDTCRTPLPQQGCPPGHQRPRARVLLRHLFALVTLALFLTCEDKAHHTASYCAARCTGPKLAGAPAPGRPRPRPPACCCAGAPAARAGCRACPAPGRGPAAARLARPRVAPPHLRARAAQAGTCSENCLSLASHSRPDLRAAGQSNAYMGSPDSSLLERACIKPPSRQEAAADSMRQKSMRPGLAGSWQTAGARRTTIRHV